MRIFTASAIAAASALGTPAFVQAQAQGTPPQSEAQTPAAQSNKLIQSVRIVNVKDLKPEMRSKVDDVVARTSEEDLQSLRKSIDATPEADPRLRPRASVHRKSLLSTSPAGSDDVCQDSLKQDSLKQDSLKIAVCKKSPSREAAGFPRPP